MALTETLSHYQVNISTWIQRAGPTPSQLAPSGQGSYTHGWTNCAQSYQQIGLSQKLYHSWCCNPTVLLSGSLGHLWVPLPWIKAEKAEGYTLGCLPGAPVLKHHTRHIIRSVFDGKNHLLVEAIDLPDVQAAVWRHTRHAKTRYHIFIGACYSLARDLKEKKTDELPGRIIQNKTFEVHFMTCNSMKLYNSCMKCRCKI